MKKLDTSILAQFIGSEEFVRYSPMLFKRTILTDGAVYLAEQAGAYWLMDIISSHQSNPKVRGEAFQTWKLQPYKNGAIAVCEDGNKNVVVTQKIPYTDFPFINGEEFKLFATDNGQYLIIMLPSEY